MMRKSLCLGASAGFVALLCGSSPALAQTVGNAQSFAIVGGTAVTAAGTGSVVNGDVGVSPGTSITGFPASASTAPPYSTHSNDGQAINAQASTLSLYNFLVAVGGATPIAAQLNAQNLGPGTYSVGAADLATNGTLTLTGNGIYIFQVASTLVANTGSSVVLAGGANPCNVYWQVTAAATLNGVNFVGNVVAQAAVTLGVGGLLSGRALTTSLGAVTLSGTNSVGGCSTLAGTPVPPVPPGSCPAPSIEPTTTSIPNQAIPISGSVSVGFTVGGGVIADALGVRATSSDPVLVPQSAMVITRGIGGARVLTVSGADGRSGVTTITITVSDPTSGCTTTTSFALTVGPIAVPTLPQWAMLALAVLVTLAGFASMRRRGTS